MKLQRLFGAFCAGLMLLAFPAGAAEQSNTVMPTSGPMSMATFAGKLNDGIRAIMSCSWGSSAPANGPSAAPIAYQCWADTTSNPVVFKRYDGAAWVVFGKLDSSSHIWTPSYQGTDLGTASTATAGTGGHTVPFLDGANTWSGVQLFSDGDLALKGSSSGAGTLKAPAAASTYVWNLPEATGTLMDTALAQTVSNKTIDCASNTCTVRIAADVSGLGTGVATALTTPSSANVAAAVTDETGSGKLVFGTSPNITTPTGIVKGDVGLGNVDNTSDATKWAATATLTNKTFDCANNTCTVRLSDITGSGTGVATFLATPSSANLRAALTDETGTGVAYFVGGALGTPASATLTNATGLPPSGITAQGAYTLLGNSSGSTASPAAIDITALTSKASPVSGDIVLIQDSAASNAFKKTTVGALASAGSVASVNGDAGAVIIAAKRGVTGLTGSRNSGTATRLDIAADQVLFVNPSTSKIAAAVAISSQAIDIATSGPAAGGRDQSGAFSSGAAVNFFFIQKDDGTIGGIASTASATTGPTLPSGYTRWAYATTVMMTGSNLQNVWVRGSSIFYKSAIVVVAHSTTMPTSSSAVSVSSYVPANARTIKMQAEINNATANVGLYSMSIGTEGAAPATFEMGVSSSGATAGMGGPFETPIASQSINYQGSSALTRGGLDVLGYTVPNGDS